MLQGNYSFCVVTRLMWVRFSECLNEVNGSILNKFISVISKSICCFMKSFFLFVECFQWNSDTTTSSQVSNCDRVVLEIYLDHKFQWSIEGLNCKSLAYKRLYARDSQFKPSCDHWNSRSIQIKLEHDTIVVR